MRVKPVLQALDYRMVADYGDDRVIACIKDWEEKIKTSTSSELALENAKK